MTNKTLQKCPFSLPFFMAEKLLEQEFSISFSEDDGFILLLATSENRNLLYLFSEEKSRSRLLPVLQKSIKNYSTFELRLPVIKAEEELRLQQLVREAGLDVRMIDRLSLTERFIYYRRKFEKSSVAI